MSTLATPPRAAEPAARNGRHRAWAGWAAVTAIAAPVLMFCYLRMAGNVPVLSDGAAIALQAQQMLHGNLLLHGWWVADVSFLTTSLPQYALVIVLAGLRPEVVHICAAMTYTLLVLLVAYVARGRATGAVAVVRALTAAAIMVAPESGVASWVLLSDPDHVGTGIPLLLLLLLLDRPRGTRWVPPAVFVLLAWASIADPLVEVIGALPLAAICLARVAVCSPRRLAALRGYSYELWLAAAAVLAVLTARVVARVIPAVGGFQMNKGVTRLIPFSEVPHNGPLLLRSVLVLFGADFQDAPGGSDHAVDLAFAAVHLVGLTLVVAAVVAGAWGLARTLAGLARASARRRGDPTATAAAAGVAGEVGAADAFAAGDLVADVLAVAIIVAIAAYTFAFRLTNIYSAHDIGPVLSLGAALAGRRFGSPLARACGLRPVTGAASTPAGVPGHGEPAQSDAEPAGDGRATQARPRAAGRRPRVTVLAALIALLACYGAMLGFGATIAQTPDQNAPLAVWLQQHGLSSGLAGYWQAASVTLDSDGSIAMGSVTRTHSGRLAPRHWEQDMRFFDPADHRATFVVLAPNSPMTERNVLLTFGPAVRVYRFETYTILVWHKNLLTELGPSVN